MSCPFAHSESELREAPSLAATGLCYEFARSGYCRNGQGCRFAHGEHELRPLPRQVAPALQGAPAYSFLPQRTQNIHCQSMVEKLHHLEEMVERVRREVHTAHVQRMAVAPQGDQRYPWASATASTSSDSCYPTFMASAASASTGQRSPSEPVSFWL